MTTLMTASRQWATRPSDERFTSLTSLNDHLWDVRRRSKSAVVASKSLTATVGDDVVNDLRIEGANGAAYQPTHWATGQLAALAGAPAGYLRTLPAALAADCLNYGLKVQREVEDVGVLLRRDELGNPMFAAATGPNYGRVYQCEVSDALVQRFGNGIDGDWRVPGEFGKRVEVTKANTTLYASDRDMFVFLADEVNRIELPNRRNGERGSLARGFFVRSSDVGAAPIEIVSFLFDYVCCNRIVWGAEEISKLSIRHTSGAPIRFLDEAVPLLAQYAHTVAGPTEAKLQAAQAKKVDDMTAFLKSRKFTGAQIVRAQAAHEAEEGRPMETIWDAVTGLTASAKAIEWQDERVQLERAAGKLIDLVAN